MTSDAEYFAIRARKERDLAARSGHGPVRRVHEELAERYSAMARSPGNVTAGERLA